MEIFSFSALAWDANVALFAAAASIVWMAGVKLTAYAKVIADRTGAGQAFVGVLLLGAVVSLPEMATSVSAAVLGDARLAANTLFGGIAATMAILAVTDALTGSEPLSSDISHPTILLQGVLVILFLTIAATGMVVGDVALGPVGLWTTVLLIFYVLFIVLVKRYGESEPWVARDGRAGERKNRHDHTAESQNDERSLVHVSIRMAVAATATLVSGFVLASTGEALAQQTGLGTSFVGMLLGGVATSLPEITTTISAVRLGQYEMAFADAFGTNMFSVMLLFAADFVYDGAPILNDVDRFSLCATLIGILVTGVYLAGFVERRHRAVLGMGIDSVVVLLVYAGGLIVLFFLR